MDTTELKKAADELHVWEPLHLITDSVPVNLAYMDRELQFRFVNRNFVERYAIPREQIIGMHVKDVVGDEFFNLVQHHIVAGLAGTEVSFTVETPESSSSPGYLQIAYHPHFDDKEEVIGIFTQSVDITERVEAVRALRASEEMYRTVFETTGTATVIIEENKTFSLVNGEFVNISGYSREEIEGKKSWTDFVTSHCREQMIRYHDARRTDDITVPDNYEFDFVDRFGIVRNILTNVRMIHGTGRSVMSYQDITVQKRALRLQDGRPEEIVGVMTDITEVRQSQKALADSEELFRAIFEQSEDAMILLMRKSLVLIDANPAAEQLFSYARNELELLGVLAFIAPEEYDSFIAAIPKPGESSVFHIDRLRHTTKSGKTILVSIWGNVINLRSEEIIICSFRNISDRIRLEEEARHIQARLIHANKMTSLGVLVSSIAHEINNPNSFIQGNAGILEKVWRDVMPILTQHSKTSYDVTLAGLPFEEIEQVVPRLLLGLKEGSRRISAIVGNLKDFAREDTSTGHNAFDVNKIVRDGALILSSLINRHTDNFMLQLDESLPPVMGKALQMEQVVINLITNGLQALPNKNAGLTVATRADQESKSILITVQDEGEGMTPEILMRITEPFFSTKLEKGGTGLGLSICSSIIKDHNGSLQFESVPGVGTTATLTLAMAQQAA